MTVHASARRASIPKLIVVIDDDPLVLEATGGLLQSWGCAVVTADTLAAAMVHLARHAQRPDLIVCDYRLSQGAQGIEVIERLRSAFEIPALLISGDAAAPPPEAANRTRTYKLLHKPLDAQKFRAALVNASIIDSKL